MEHILKQSHLELERTHTLVETYKTSGIKEIFFSIFGKSFKTVLHEYAHQKEEVLMEYSSLYADMSKDIHDSHATPTDVEHIRNSLFSITNAITYCAQTLEKLIAHSHRQEEILHHEKVFFTNLLESFNADLLDWVGAHEKEVFGEISNLQNDSGRNPLESGKALLEMRKKKLETYVSNIPKD